jgi:DNA-binding transcriptional ArsR family regulator
LQIPLKIKVGWPVHLREIALVAGDGNRIDQQLVRALSHPTRVEILEKLQGRIASPVELSQELNKSPSVISYHACTLLQCGCVELIGSEPRKGSLENVFGIRI